MSHRKGFPATPGGRSQALGGAAGRTSCSTLCRVGTEQARWMEARGSLAADPA